MSTIYKDKNITKMYYGSTPVYSFSVEDGGGASSGLDFSSIGYDDKLSKEINDEYNADIAYSKQLLDEWDSSSTSAYRLYYNNTNLIYAPNIDTSNVTTMQQMFYGCSSLTAIPLLDTSKVTNMQYMFYSCNSLTTIPLLDTSKVTNMYYAFENCSSLTTIPLLNTSNVTAMPRMFFGCSSLTTIPLLDTSKVTNMGYMFNGCTNLTTIPELDCGSVTNSNSPIGTSNLSKLTELGGFKNLKVTWTTYSLDRIPNVTVESLMNVINNLWDWSGNTDGKAPLNNGTIYNFGTTHKLSFGSTNLNKLTPEQIAVATNKGWTLT